MADCSKTLDFFIERKRLCDSYSCKMCPAQLIFKIPDVCPLFDNDLCDEKLIDYLQRWSDEHPAPKPKTYADDFFEKLPKAKRYRCGETDVPSFCIDNYYALGKRSSCSLQCHSCLYEPYPEQEDKT